MMNITEKTSVALVGAEYPVNVGHTARLVKNFGVSRLYLVDPHFDRRVASVYAAHGASSLDEAIIVGFGELRERHDLLVATTAITARRRGNVNRLAIPPEEVVQHVSRARSPVVVFGRDTTGLRNEEIAVCDLVASIPTGTAYRTLNVSHSIAIMLYLLSRGVSIGGRGAPPPSLRREQRPIPARRDRDMLATYAFELAVKSGLQQHRAVKLKKLANRMSVRSNLDGKELGLLVSLLRRASILIERESRQHGKLGFDQSRSNT